MPRARRTADHGRRSIRAVRFQLNYKVQGPNAPFLYASDSGLFAEAGLEVEFLEGLSLTRATREVAHGVADIGFGDASHALELALKSGSARVCALMPIYLRSPCSLGYMARRTPLALGDLAGAVLAGPDGDTSARLLPALLAKNDLTSLAYSLRTVTPEARDRMLAAGDVLAVTCFDATLMFSMRAGGYDTADLRFLYFADHGLDLYTGALVCAQGLIAEEPGLPERLRWVVGEALQACRRDPDKGVGAVMKRRPEADPGLVRDHLMWVLEKNVFPAAERSPELPTASMSFVMDSERMATTIAAAKASALGLDAPVAEEARRGFDDSSDGLSSILQHVFPSADARK